MLRINDLSYAYGKQKIYSGFNLHVPGGQVCLITGINGVGKSTLLRLIAGVLKPASGSVNFNENMGPNPMRQVGFISDKLSMYKDITVKEAIRLHREVFQLESIDDSLILHTQIDQKKKVKELSIGQQTILHLSLVISNRPRLLLLDEVIQPLDAYLKKLFLKKLLELISEHQITVVMVNLNFHDIEHIIDRVILLKNGAIEVDEPIDQLKQKVRKVVSEKEPEGLPIVSRIEFPDVSDYFVYPFKEEYLDQIDGEVMDLNLTDIVSAFIGGEYAEKRN